eukprot:CAMPEP_0206142432 /NCGR_PEP_ID=MMETSP1473-20131121/16814_1 /ASSEMBLY_ACC=CAM_ASM_001109 /TAXON_ID=1461547 /ORGANISM="Stichococcus sp, Strain RCC1054" /LENGTH=314 /DNA_ID=CAMNT_0053537429 /DNA_START=144 /DNA_END=1089 /DNA_ORIENTATION=+
MSDDNGLLLGSIPDAGVMSLFLFLSADANTLAVKEHESSTGYPPDDYSAPFSLESGRDWRDVFQSPPHPCFDPEKDLVIPTVHMVSEFEDSPMLGSTPLPRTKLAYWRGETGIGTRLPQFSRGLRQRLKTAAEEGSWEQQHGIVIQGHAEPTNQSYSAALASSMFCVVLPGDGWARRADDAILHGCLPVIVQDGVQEKFESLLDYAAFSIRIPEADLESLPEILHAIPATQRQEMQITLGNIWHRFVYSLSLLTEEMEQIRLQRQEAQAFTPLHGDYASLPHPFEGSYAADDAGSTIFQWLYSRIDAVHSGEAR